MVAGCVGGGPAPGGVPGGMRGGKLSAAVRGGAEGIAATLLPAPPPQGGPIHQTFYVRI